MHSFFRRFRSLLSVILVVSSPLAAAPSLRLNFGADYWFDRAGQFSATLGILGRLTREVAAGGCVGAVVNTQPAAAGLPVGFYLPRSPLPLFVVGVSGVWYVYPVDV